MQVSIGGIKPICPYPQDLGEWKPLVKGAILVALVEICMAPRTFNAYGYVHMFRAISGRPSSQKSPKVPSSKIFQNPNKQAISSCTWNYNYDDDFYTISKKLGCNMLLYSGSIQLSAMK